MSIEDKEKIFVDIVWAALGFVRSYWTCSIFFHSRFAVSAIRHIILYLWCDIVDTFASVRSDSPDTFSSQHSYGATCGSRPPRKLTLSPLYI